MQIKQATQKDFVKTAVRLPPELHRSLRQAALEAERTLNAELIHRLRTSLTQPTKGQKQ